MGKYIFERRVYLTRGKNEMSVHITYYENRKSFLRNKCIGNFKMNKVLDKKFFQDEHNMTISLKYLPLDWNKDTKINIIC